MKYVTLAIVLLLLSLSAHADDAYLVSTIGSHHFDQRKDGKEWNQQNYGLGGEYIWADSPDDVARSGIVGGFYKDSFGTTAKYVGWTGSFRLSSKPFVDVGIAVVGIRSPSYYGIGAREPGGLVIAPIPTLSIGHGMVAAQFVYIPKAPLPEPCNNCSASASLGLQLKFKLN